MNKVEIYPEYHLDITEPFHYVQDNNTLLLCYGVIRYCNEIVPAKSHYKNASVVLVEASNKQRAIEAYKKAEGLREQYLHTQKFNDKMKDILQE